MGRHVDKDERTTFKKNGGDGASFAPSFLVGKIFK
jgi:hypothetical protein